MKKKILIGLGVIIAIPVVLFIIVYGIHKIFTGDLAEVNDKDLLLETVNISDKDNAYFDLVKLNEIKFYETASSSTELLEAKNLDLKQVKELFDKNSEALKMLEDFSNKIFFIEPVMADPSKLRADSEIITGTKLREVTRILILKSRYELESKHDTTAYEDVKTVISSGHKLSGSQGRLTTYLVGVSMEKIGLETLDRIVEKSKNNKLLSEIHLYFPNFEIEINKTLFKDDYVMLKNLFGDPNFLADAKEQHMIGMNYCGDGYCFKKNMTLDIVAKNIREIVNNYQKDCGEENKKIVRESEEPTRATLIFNALFIPNSTGTIIADVGKMNLSNVKDRRCENEKQYSEIKTKLEEKLK